MKIIFSLHKTDKLLTKKDFTAVFKRKKCFNTGKSLRIYYRLNQTALPRMGLIVSKKVAKKAVARNYMKRVLREWFRQRKTELPAGDYIFLVKSGFIPAEFAAIQSELNYFRQKITAHNGKKNAVLTH